MISAISDALYFPSQSQCWAHLWIIHGATRLLCINRTILIISATSTYAWCHAEKSVVVLPSFQIQNTFTLLAKLGLPKVFFNFFWLHWQGWKSQGYKRGMFCFACRHKSLSLEKAITWKYQKVNSFTLHSLPLTVIHYIFKIFLSSIHDKPVYLHTSNRD